MNPRASADEGGYFEFETHEPGASVGDPWRSMSELAQPSAAWVDRIAETRAALAASVGLAPDAIEQRVAASVAHLGVCARIVAPALAVAMLDRRVPETALDALWWQPSLGGPFPLSVRHHGAVGRPAPTDQLIAGLRAGLVGETAASLVGAVRYYSVSAHIAWGNVASAVHGAATMLAREHPDVARDVSAVVTGLFAAPPLDRTAERSAHGAFRRRSCCLIYRVGGWRTAVCGDCVLRPA